MKKISLVVLLGLVLSAVALTGCNQSDTSSTPPATTNAAPPATTNK